MCLSWRLPGGAGIWLDITKQFFLCKINKTAWTHAKSKESSQQILVLGTDVLFQTFCNKYTQIKNARVPLIKLYKLASIIGKMKFFCLRLKYAYCREKSKVNLILIWAKADIRFLRNYCWKILCFLLILTNILIKLLRKTNKDAHKHDKYQLVAMFTNILWIKIHATFILQNLCLKLCQYVSMALNINK